MGLSDLFVASTVPVLKVLLVTALGSYIASDGVGILVDDARKHLNKLTFFVFSPALVYSNLAKTITYDSMMKMWFMPINILFTFIIGSVLGWVVVQITRTPSHLRGLVIGSCAAGNLGNLLVIIIPAVCKERASPFGDPGVCHEKGMGYASLSMAIGAVYLWLYVYNIVRVSIRSSIEVKTSDSPTDSNKSSVRESSTESIDGGVEEPLLSSLSDQESVILSLPQSISENKPKQVSVWGQIKQRFEGVVEKMNLKRLFAPSTIAAIVGFVVGLVPQIEKLLIGESAPLRVIQDSAFLLGDGAIPAITLVMGGNLLKGLKASGIQKSIIFCIIGVRYIALPIIGVGIVRGAIRLGVVRADDLLYQFVLLLQYSLPPAMNIGTITQLFGVGEKECSVIMLWCYSLASVSLTLWSTVFLWMLA